MTLRCEIIFFWYPCNTLTIGPGEVKKKKKKKKPKKKKKVEQGDPPRTGLSKVYPDGKYPVGEIQEYRNEWVTECIMSIMTGSSIPS
jgi:hypothetical protein